MAGEQAWTSSVFPFDERAVFGTYKLSVFFLGDFDHIKLLYKKTWAWPLDSNYQALGEAF